MSSKDLIKSLQRNQFSKIINSLKTDIQEAETKNGGFYLTLNFNEKPNLNTKEYAKDLIHQIKEKNERDHKEKKYYKEQGFSDEISGYPNIPQTPKEIKRKKELEKMKEIKKDLDLQIELKNKFIQENYLNELNLDQKINTEIYNQLCIEKKEKNEKQVIDREELLSSWQNAQQARLLKQKLDDINSKGLSPRTGKGSKEGKKIINSESNYNIKGIRSVSPLPNIENQISAKQLSTKIQKVIQVGKETRKNMIKSKSPIKKY